MKLSLPFSLDFEREALRGERGQRRKRSNIADRRTVYRHEKVAGLKSGLPNSATLA